MFSARLRARLAATTAEHFWIRTHEAATFLDLLVECCLLLLEPYTVVAQLLLSRRFTFFVFSLLVPRQRLCIFAKLLGKNLSTLPFLPDDTIRSDAMLGNRTTRDAIIIINQEAIFGKLPT